ncbi:pyridine nucleotide-disulfide oxidoreductase, partial [candidate division GN15 bacterium]|nr:pyridine nucleotide-disulfide oxidoreductase [candidate division GN15 bacterium]
TTLIEKEPQVLPYVLDREMAAVVERELTRQDVTVKTNCATTKIEVDAEGNPVVHTDGGETITADYVFVCLGVHPEVGLAKEAGLEIGSTGAIKIDRHMRTSDEHIYAGGDCVETINQITGQPMFIPMGSLANRHGRVIAENLAGRESSFPGAVGAFLVKVYDANIGAVGLSERAAAAQGLNVSSLWGTFPDKPDYYPESQTFVLKMTYESGTGRLLGLQAVGKGDICRRIDVFSSLLQHGGTIQSLLDFEQGYAPPYSEALDPLFHLGCMAEARESGTVFVSPGIAYDSADVQFVDVREEAEFTGESWSEPRPGWEAINIPLNDLRERVGDLDRSKRTVILCKRGPRSFQAAQILRAAGFSQVEILAGGLQSQQ